MSLEISLGSDAFIPAILPEVSFPFRKLAPGFFLLEFDGKFLRAAVSSDASGTWITVEGRLLRVREAAAGTSVGAGSLLAPMPGRVVRLTAKQGDSVEAGAELLRLEAMKMEHAVKAPRKGKVKAFLVKEGEQVQGGRLLVDFE